MTLDERRHFRVCCLMFKCMHGLVPNYLSDRVLMQFDMHEYSTRSSFNNDMYLPVPNTDALKKTLFYYGAKSWNCLPHSIKEHDSVTSFRNACILHFRNGGLFHP